MELLKGESAARVLRHGGELFLEGTVLEGPKNQAMFELTLAKLAELLECTFHGDVTLCIKGVCSVDEPRAGCIAMAETVEHWNALQGSPVSAVLHGGEVEVTLPGLVHPQPRVAFARLLELFYPEPAVVPGVHPTAVVDPRAEVHPSAQVGPYCSLGPGVVVGPDCVLQAFVSLAEGAKLGRGCRLYAHAMVGSCSELGDDCRLEPWAQVGNDARLGEGVDLGAHTALGNGVKVAAGAKFDNLVVVGPRSEIGSRSLLVGQSFVDRDAVLHSGVILAGQSAVGPGAELGSGVQLGGRSLAVGKLDKPGPYLGNPAIPLKDEMRRRIRERRSGSSD